MPSTVRRAGPGDIPVLVDLMSEFYAEAQYGLDRDWAAASFAQLLRDAGRGAVWIAFDGPGAQGYVVLTTRHSMEFGGLDGFVDDMFVRPQHRGCGVGTSLLSALFGHCGQNRILAVHVE